MHQAPWPSPPRPVTSGNGFCFLCLKKRGCWWGSPREVWGQVGHWGDAEGLWGLVSWLGTGSGAAGALLFGEYHGDRNERQPGRQGRQLCVKRRWERCLRSFCITLHDSSLGVVQEEPKGQGEHLGSRRTPRYTPFPQTSPTQQLSRAVAALGHAAGTPQSSTMSTHRAAGPTPRVLLGACCSCQVLGSTWCSPHCPGCGRR